MYKNKAIFRVMLVCICITLVAGCIGVGALASSTAKPVLQVNDIFSSAVLTDGNIQVSLGQKDVFTYNEILDLSTSTTDAPLLNMQFNPSDIGKADAVNVMLRFTDLYDEENYFTINLNHIVDDWAENIVFITAGAAGQPRIGLENAGNPDSMTVHIDSIYGYGAAVDYSMSGLPKYSDDTCLTLYLDYEEKAIYVDRDTYTRSRQLVVDLDEADYFGDNLWTGFTTGQAKLSVFASNYQSATCNFTISTINGNSQFHDSDVTAPMISVNTGFGQDELPAALVGKPYPVFEATALDGCDGDVETTVAVYQQLDAAEPVEVAVQDGKFTPPEAGVYVIEYTAQDLSGNIATKSVSVNAVTGDGLQITLQDAITQMDTGASVPVVSGIAYEGASGNVSYSIVAKNITTGNEAEIDTQTYCFTPMEAGDWEVTVTARDYVSTVVKTFTVTANRTSQPQVFDTVRIQDYFVLGATYQLPTLYGYDFSSGKGVLTAMDVYVTENGSSETAVANGKYTPAVAGSVTVTYRLTVDGMSCEKSYTATVLNVKTVLNTVNLSKYFVVSAGAATASTASSKITFSFSKDTKLDFANPVQVKQLTFAFQVGSRNNYNKISVYLTDVVSGKQVKLSYIKTDAGVAFSVNDGAEKQLTASSFVGSYSLAFSGDTGIVVPETGTEIKVNKFLDGSAFTGFTDSVACFAVEMSGVTSSSQFVINTLNGHKMNNATRDSVAPQLITNTSSGTIAEGEMLQLKGVFVYDVLDPVATATLKVTDPDGTIVTDENGAVLDGTFDATLDTVISMDKLGTYTFLYTAKDSRNTGRQIYTITTVDGTKPIITLSEHVESVKTGDTVTIAEAQVTDNYTQDCTVASYVFDPEGISIAVTDGTFVAEEGVYTVRYMASDAAGNYTFASYEIEAKAEESSYITQSVSLGSDLTLHLWGNVPENYVSSLSGTLAYDDVADKFKLSELTPTADGLYHMQADMAAAQLTEHINLTLEHKVIGEVIRKNYSIRDYLVALTKGNYDQATKDLSLELLNMGAWAQKYFDYNVSDLANTGYEITPANAIPTESPTVGITGEINGIRFYGTSVRFLSQTAVRFYFKADGAVDGYTFTIGDTTYEPVAKDGLYYIETPGINPQNMSDVITVNVTDGSNTLSVQYAPIWYFIRTYNKSTDDTTKGLMAAAYSYYKAAEAYEIETTTGEVKQPEAPTGESIYICVDLLITTLGNSTDPVDIGFFPYDFEGDINNYTDKIAITAGTTTTVKLNAEKYMVDGVIPDGLGIAIFGGPAWDDKLSDGYTPDRHTLTISNARLTGAYEGTLDLSGAEVNTGTNRTGYTNANGSGTASVGDDTIVITGGFRYDGHKISLAEDTSTYLNMDLLITTLSNSTESVEVRFYPHDFDGNVHEEYTNKIVVTAGTTASVKLNIGKYLVDGQLPGIGVAIFGGPEWNTQISDGVYDRHELTISNMRLEGTLAQTIDLNEVTVTTGFAESNSGGTASIVDGQIVVTNGFRYDGHKLTFGSAVDMEQ